MEFKVLYMSVRDVFSEGKPCTVTILQRVLSVRRWWAVIAAPALVAARRFPSMPGTKQMEKVQAYKVCGDLHPTNLSCLKREHFKFLFRFQKHFFLFSQIFVFVFFVGMDDDKELLMSQMNFEKRFGQSAIFVTSTLMIEGGVPPSTSPAALLKEAIHVISCGYEDKTEWGLEVKFQESFQLFFWILEWGRYTSEDFFALLLTQLGWIYGSITEDILTGFKMHCRGWRSIYCMPKRPAFKGTAPINLSDRLNQVLRWALGSIEIFFSHHSPLLYGYKEGKLKWLERFSYVNTTVYPFTSLPLLAYCTLPAICLLTDKFIMPPVKLFDLFFSLNKLNNKKE